MGKREAGQSAPQRHSQRRLVAGALLTLCAAAGAGLLLAAFTMEPPRPPQPEPVANATSAASATPASRAPVTVAPSPSASPQAASLARAEPTKIEIPAIGVSAGLLSLGLDAKNELAVPPFDKAEMAGWYNLGASPGELGSAVIVGHVDSEKLGPAVFFNLGKLKPGDLIKVHRRDGVVAQFKVDSVRSVLKSQFPTEEVYGGFEQATLKVVTCGGEYDKKNKNYLSNVVVFATYLP